MKKTSEQTNTFIQKVAQHQNWEVIPDKEFLFTLIEGLTEHYNKFGYYLCPCREGWGDRKKDKDVICPCNYAAADIDEFGHCYCALYCSSNFKASGKEVQSIPERRDPDLFP